MAFERFAWRMVYILTVFVIVPCIAYGLAKSSPDRGVLILVVFVLSTAIALRSRRSGRRHPYMPGARAFLFLTVVTLVGVAKSPEVREQSLAGVAPDASASNLLMPADQGAWRAPVLEGTLSADTPASSPKLFQTWGTEGVRRIYALRHSAAESISTNRECDAVELVEYSQNRSQYPDKPVVFVDCSNQKRFYVSEADIGQPVSSQSAKSGRYRSAEVERECRRSVQTQLSFPSSMDLTMFSTSSSIAETTGNWIVEFEFEAKNSLGLVLPYSARCVMTPEGAMEATIYDR